MVRFDFFCGLLLAILSISIKAEEDFNILLQYSVYYLHRNCDPISSDPLKCQYYIYLPVGGAQNSTYPAYNCSLQIDLSQPKIFWNASLIQSNQCDESGKYTSSGCYLNNGTTDCTLLGVRYLCRTGWSDALIFNHSYEYSPRGDGTTATTDTSYSISTHPSQVPFFSPINAPMTRSLLGLSPDSLFGDFVRSVYTVKYNEFSFAVNEDFKFEIEPNLMLYNQIFQFTINDTWVFPNFNVTYIQDTSWTLLEDGSIPVCPTLMNPALIYVQNASTVKANMFTYICGESSGCPYTQQNMDRASQLTFNISYSDEKTRNTYILRLNAQMFSKNIKIDGNQMIVWLIDDVKELTGKKQCPGNTRIAVGLPFFQYFRFEFVFNKKVNSVRFWEKNNGLDMRAKFYLMNFAGALLLTFMIALAIRIAYKYY